MGASEGGQIENSDLQASDPALVDPPTESLPAESEPTEDFLSISLAPDYLDGVETEETKEPETEIAIPV